MIKFNGVQFRDYFDKIRSISRSLVPAQELTVMELPKRPGGYVVNRKDGIRVFKFGVQTTANSLEELQTKLQPIKKHLIVDKAAPLELEDEPGKTYYAFLSGATDIDQKWIVGEHELTFICPDPYAYGAEKTFETTETDFVINVEGDAQTPPYHEITFKEDSTAIMLLDEDGRRFIMGLPENAEYTTVDPKVLYMEDQMNSLAGWTTSTAGVDGGKIDGSFGIQDDVSFYPADYGTGTDWHGPAAHKTLGKNMQDFEAEFRITQNNAYRDRIGRIEIYLTDGSDNVIAKLAMKDISKGFSNNEGEVRLGTLAGDKYLVAEGSDNHGWWNNFYNGKLVIRREGKYFSGRIARVDEDGREFNVREFEHYDYKNKYQMPFRRIRVHAARMGTILPTTQTIDNVKVFDLNVSNTFAVPKMAKAGDVITVNMANGDIRKNGADARSYMNKLSDFMKLKPGANNLSLLPEGKADLKTTYKPGWL